MTNVSLCYMPVGFDGCQRGLLCVTPPKKGAQGNEEGVLDVVNGWGLCCKWQSYLTMSDKYVRSCLACPGGQAFDMRSKTCRNTRLRPHRCPEGWTWDILRKRCSHGLSGDQPEDIKDARDPNGLRVWNLQRLLPPGFCDVSFNNIVNCKITRNSLKRMDSAVDCKEIAGAHKAVGFGYENFDHRFLPRSCVEKSFSAG